MYQLQHACLSVLLVCCTCLNVQDAPPHILRNIALSSSEWVYKEFATEQDAKASPPADINSLDFFVHFTVHRFFRADSASLHEAQKATLIVHVIEYASGEEYHVLVLAFRGTVSLQDWIVNIGGITPSTVPFERIGLGVASGWHAMTTSHSDTSLTNCVPAFQCAMLQAFIDVLELGVKTFLFTGHSLGGALAQVATMLVLQLSKFSYASVVVPAPVLRLMRRSRCVTFGSPTPFHLTAKQFLTLEQSANQLWARRTASEQFLNYINNNDPVPRFPGEIDFIERYIGRVKASLVVGAFGIAGTSATGKDVAVFEAFLEARRQLPMVERYTSLSTVLLIGHEGHSWPLRGYRAQKGLKRERIPDPASIALAGGLVNWAAAGLPVALEDHRLDRYTYFALPSVTSTKEEHSSSVNAVAADFHMGSAVAAIAADFHLGKAISSSHDGTVKVWNLLNGEFERTLEGHTDCVTAVAADFRLGTVISASLDGTVKVWNLLSGECERTLEGHRYSVTAVAADFQLGKIISASHDGTVKVWNLLNGECERTLKGHGYSVTAFVADFHLGKVISASLDGKVKVCNWLSRECELTLEGHTDWVTSFAADFRLGKIISASLDGTIKVWNLLNGACERTFEGHTDSVSAVAADFHLGKAISASHDGTVKVWNLLTGECECTLKGHASWVNAVAADFPLGRAISASHDRTIKVWDLAGNLCMHEH